MSSVSMIDGHIDEPKIIQNKAEINLKGESKRRKGDKQQECKYINCTCKNKEDD